jgi:hypothetical protein
MINVPRLEAATPMELTLRIGDVRDATDANFRADMALREHYNLAPYHRPYFKNVMPPTQQPKAEIEPGFEAPPSHVEKV